MFTSPPSEVTLYVRRLTFIFAVSAVTWSWLLVGLGSAILCRICVWTADNCARKLVIAIFAVLSIVALCVTAVCLVVVLIRQIR
jgi:hypothetical protein